MPRKLVKHYFRVCLWRYFWKRLAFESADCLKISITHMGDHPFLWEPEHNKKAEKGQICSVWAETSIFCPSVLLAFRLSNSHWKLCHQRPILRPSDSEWIMPLAFLVLQLGNSKSEDFLASIQHEPIPKIYLLIHTYISYWFSSSEQPYYAN